MARALRITITTGGSRGEVQPYVALGLGLEAAGHEVRISAQAAYQQFVQERGLGFHPISGDPHQLVSELLEAGNNPVRFARRFRRVLGSLMEPNLEEYLAACRDAEVIIYSPVGFLGYYVAEALGVPRVGAALYPLFSRTKHFPSSIVPLGKLRPRGTLGGLYNYLTYPFSEQLFWQSFRTPASRAMEEHVGVSPPFLGPFGEMTRHKEPILYGWSPSVLAQPPDWGSWLHTTGYWFLDRPDGWQAPLELADFLEAGPPPVFIGFGSMNNIAARKLTDIVLQALELTGQRGLLATGWGGMGDADLPDTAFRLEDVPHDWLFERVKAAIHHGGAGTTSASLRAGVPTLVVPFFADQPFWGWSVAELGVGPEPISPRSLGVEQLAGAIRRITSDRGMRARAAALGQRIRNENGIERAVEAFDLHTRKVSSARK
jgi:sterol 3beta-glucosyltransferase